MLAYLFYRLAYHIALHLSLTAAYRVATFLSILKYCFSPRDRRAVIHNLKIILPESEHKYINRYAREVFSNFGKYMIEFFRFELFKKEGIHKYVHVKGLKNIDEALKNKKGVIILSAHIGNWELGGVFMALIGYPMIAVALPHKHSKVNDLFNHQRELAGAVVVPSMGAAMRKIYKALKDNKIVALVGDRDFANGGESINFLGLSKTIPKGPAVLSLKTGAAIVPGFVTRQKDGSHVLEFFPPIPKMSDEKAIMQQYANIIENEIKKYPTQWLMFREFEKE